MAKAKPKQKETLPVPTVDEKERQALEAIRHINERIHELIPNKNTGVIVIQNQEQADLAGELAIEEDKAIEYIDGLWRDEAKMADQLHKSITGKIRKYTQPEKNRKDQIRAAIKLFVDQMNAKRIEAQAAVNAAVQKQFGDMPVAPPIVAPVRVFGFSTAVERSAVIVDRIKLIRELLKGIEKETIPADVIEIDQKFLNDQSRQYYDSTKPDKDGKRYRFNGALELVEGSQLRKERS